MRWLVAVILVALASCSGKGGPSSAQLRVGESLHRLYEDWDDTTYREVMPGGPEPSALRQRFAWYRERAGACERPRVLVSKGRKARFEYRCARGTWEAEILIPEDGSSTTTRLLTGLRDAVPPPAVQQRANAALKLYHQWDDALVEQTFDASFDRTDFRAFLDKTRAAWGGCVQSGVDLGSPTGGLLELDCEVGPRLMVVDVGADGRIARFYLQGRRPIRKG